MFNRKTINQGFTLIEIGVVVLLIGLFTSIVLTNFISDRFYLEQDMTKIADAITKAGDQAVLQGKIFQIVFNLGPKASLQIKEAQDRDVLITDDNETTGKFLIMEKIELKGESELLYVVTKGEKIEAKTSSDIIFLPMGERSPSLIILTNYKEMVTLEVQPFNREIIQTFYEVEKLINTSVPEFLEKQVLDKAEEMASDWAKV